MSRLNLWLLGAAIGIATLLVWALTLLVGIAVALLAIPLARKPGGLAAVSGLLSGFGALWLVLMAVQSSSGGVLDSATFWATVGAVPLVIGLALLVWVVSAARSPGDAPG